MHKIGWVRCLLLAGFCVLTQGATCVPIEDLAILDGGNNTGTTDTSGYAAQVIDLTNAQRQANGLQPLAQNNILTQVAQAYAQKMADDNFFAHQDPTNGQMPWDRATAAGYTWTAIGENIAAGQETPQEVVTAWMNSPEHRDNILSTQLTEIGVGFYQGGISRTYWVQVFGHPR